MMKDFALPPFLGQFRDPIHFQVDRIGDTHIFHAAQALHNRAINLLADAHEFQADALLCLELAHRE